ncbi:hypothetical protein G6F45_005405 [Rhizopus arrhizus]|nr:hypothetical protein G6F45_005405 [Rhizopus arrhizus]
MSIQIKTCFKIPPLTLITLLWKRTVKKSVDMNVPLASHERVYSARFYHLFSLLFIITFTISLAIITGATSGPNPSSVLLQAALFVLVLSINLYLITRQRCYYMQKRKLFGEHDAHINAVYDTRFSQWDKSMWSNWVQIAILVIEFFQLMTFPLRDLITITSFHHSSVSFVLNVGGFMPDMRTPAWYTYSLWTAFAVTLCSMLLGILIHSINLKYPYKLSTRWVRWFIPVAVSQVFHLVQKTYVSLDFTLYSNLASEKENDYQAEDHYLETKSAAVGSRRSYKHYKNTKKEKLFELVYLNGVSVHSATLKLITKSCTANSWMNDFEKEPKDFTERESGNLRSQSLRWILFLPPIVLAEFLLEEEVKLDISPLRKKKFIMLIIRRYIIQGLLPSTIYAQIVKDSVNEISQMSQHITLTLIY